MTGDIGLEMQDGIATVTFNRPEQRNAIDYRGWLELGRIAAELAADSTVTVVVFTGKGDEAFSAGADIKDFDTHRRDSTTAKEYAAAFDGALDAIESLPIPTICCIKGYCVGGGCELAMAADLRVAADNSRFGVPVARLGILVGYSEMRRLVNLVGPAHASYILLTGRLIDATEALRVGLINEVVPTKEIDDYVQDMAREVGGLAPLSHRRHKTIIQAVLRDPTLEGLTAEEKHLPFTNFDSEDFQEGRRAFIEHRPPRFTGR